MNNLFSVFFFFNFFFFFLNAGIRYERLIESNRNTSETWYISSERSQLILESQNSNNQVFSTIDSDEQNL